MYRIFPLCPSTRLRVPRGGEELGPEGPLIARDPHPKQRPLDPKTAGPRPHAAERRWRLSAITGAWTACPRSAVGLLRQRTGSIDSRRVSGKGGRRAGVSQSGRPSKAHQLASTSTTSSGREPVRTRSAKHESHRRRLSVGGGGGLLVSKGDRGVRGTGPRRLSG